MLKIFSIFIFLFSSLVGYSQYDSECFINTKKEIKLAIENIPVDSVHFQDTLVIDGKSRYVDTMFAVRNMNVDPYIIKIIGCTMPDFSFFNLDGQEFSINKTKADFIVLNFSFDCGDICSYQLDQFSKLQKVLGDSIAIYNIYDEPNERVKEIPKTYKIDNLQFVANADLLTFSYSLNVRRPFLYLLDSHKNIIYVKAGQSQTETATYIYDTLLEKIRSTHCGD